MAGSSRRRRVLVPGGIVVVLLAVFVGPTLTGDAFSAFPRGACKGVGLGLPIGADPAAAGVPAGFATPEAALAAFAPVAPSLGPDAVPADGWERYRGRWVRDMAMAPSTRSTCTSTRTAGRSMATS